MDNRKEHYVRSSGFGKRKSHPTVQQQVSNQAGNASIAAMALFFGMLILAGAITYYIFPTNNRQEEVLLIIPWFISGAALICARMCRRGRADKGIFLLLYLFTIGMGMMGLLSSGTAWLWGGAALLISLSIAYHTLNEKQFRQTGIALSIISLGMILLSLWKIGRASCRERV